MNRELTTDELKDVIREARVYCLGFSEKQFQNLLVLEKHLAESGYLEAVDALARLERQGVPCAKALDECESLKQRNSELEQRVSDVQAKLQSLDGKLDEAEKKYEQVTEATRQTNKQLEEIRAEREKEEKALIAFRAEADKKRQDLDNEVAECRQRATVTEQEIATARQLKAEIAAHGFSLEVVLGLSQEFSGHENVREEVTKALKKYGAFSEYLTSINEEGEARKKTLGLEISRLQTEKEKRQAGIESLEAVSHNLEGILSKLQSDLANENDLRRFRSRYKSVSGLMEYLATWQQLFFLRCNSPTLAVAGVFDRSAGLARFLSEKLAVKCPHCGQNTIAWDADAYSTLNCGVGPVRLRLGE
jgi:DNA repair exonuclease SbcCD ATPase subunit